jgi:conjugal transfer ATP-binding protein TraC
MDLLSPLLDLLDRGSLKEADLDLHNRRFSRLLPYKSADFRIGYGNMDEGVPTDLYYLKDNSLLRVYECMPLVLSSEETYKSISGMIQKHFPEGTVIQFSLLADDYVGGILKDYARLRGESGGMFAEQTRRLSAHYIRGTKGMDQLSGTPVRNFRLIISFKIPMGKMKPYEADWERSLKEILNYLRDAESTLKNISLKPKVVKPDEFITLLTSILNPDLERTDRSWDINQTIDRQVIFADTIIEVAHNYIKLGDTYGMCITPKKYPAEMDFYKANSLIGLMNGNKSTEDDSRQIRSKFLYSIAIIKTNLKGLIAKKGKQASLQQTPEGGTLAPGVNARKSEYGWAFTAMEKGEEFCRIIPQLWIFNEDIDTLNMIVSDTKSIWESGIALESQTEQDYLLPKMLVSALPGGLYGKDTLQLQRDWILTTEAAAHFAVTNAGYIGNGKPYLLFVDRRGQLTKFDFFNTAANRNILITGGTGGGKSFLMNYIVSSYYSCGHRVRILDVGGSYEKLSYLVGGTYIYLIKDKIIMNFFETLKLPNFETEGMDEEEAEAVMGTLDMLVSIVATMAYSRTGNSAGDAEIVLIEKAIKACYAIKQQSMTINDIADYLDHISERFEESDDKYVFGKYEDSIKKAHFLSEALQKFTSKGEYGRFFNGKTNVSLDNQLVVTELNNLPEDLKKVLVLAISSIISDQVYRGNNHPTLIFLDEAWQTLSENPAVAKFVEGLYRKVRKHNGGVGIITQSVSDLDPEHGKLKALGSVLKTQAAFHFIILDKDFSAAADKGVVEVSEFEKKFYYDRMPDPKTIQYRYSEIFIKGEGVSSVVRLLIDQYTYMCNTSAADEKDYIIYLTESYMRQGLTKKDALQRAIDDCDALTTKLGNIGAFSDYVSGEMKKIRRSA